MSSQTFKQHHQGHRREKNRAGLQLIQFVLVFIKLIYNKKMKKI